MDTGQGSTSWGPEDESGQDPYGTPPYGQPGPWAPAPPVQHPTPASGTPTGTPAAGTAMPPGASAPAPQAPPPPASPPPASRPAGVGLTKHTPATGTTTRPPEPPAASAAPPPAGTPGPATTGAQAHEHPGTPSPADGFGPPPGPAGGQPPAADTGVHGPGSAAASAPGTGSPGAGPGAPAGQSPPPGTPSAAGHGYGTGPAAPAGQTPAAGTPAPGTGGPPPPPAGGHGYGAPPTAGTAGPEPASAGRTPAPGASGPTPPPGAPPTAGHQHGGTPSPGEAAATPAPGTGGTTPPQGTPAGGGYGYGPAPAPGGYGHSGAAGTGPGPASAQDGDAHHPAGQAGTPGGYPQAPPGDGLRRYDPWGVSVPAAAEAAGTADATRPRRGTLVFGAVVIALVAGLIGGGVGVYLEREGQFSAVRLPQAGSERESAPAGSIAGIAETALPGVVTLHVQGGGAAGTGTGFVLDDRGHILTNAHVVRPAAGRNGAIQVTFHSGDTASAEIVGQDAGYDLAVVKVTGVSGLTPLPLGDSDGVRVGDPVVAIGAPFDLAGTVTSGIISAVNRPITAGGEESDGSDVSYVNALQTDAPINPGNSGGPLVDLNGHVIGINSAIRAPEPMGADGGQAGSVGLGFAIPINQGKDIAEQLINTGRATHPVIGVTLDLSYRGTGAKVGTAAGNDGGTAVEPGGPGDRAGLREGDVITAVNGERVRSGDELIVKIRSHRPGDELVLTVERGAEELRIPVTLGEASGS
ncbi:trypsin-like peptidase domain-containing protein [Streptomyces sp. G-5]|uniref:trypsin-like peptidase domain-containing protein n=1 Tax=Streptomyces sp. G-5 TaxID=2977231 RepID=UPI0021D36A62|nr:trypsin-like peptidase domain-containing protein [Streptomyces sp. G-5]MCU4746857.1 trypsin-like peptidase domain-containing protein [Streptomyces sp. G-5]